MYTLTTTDGDTIENVTPQDAQSYIANGYVQTLVLTSAYSMGEVA